MSLMLWVVALAGLGSLGGLAVASGILTLGEGLRQRLLPWLISYAVGTLLGVSLLALVPEALVQLSPALALRDLLAGILTFFLLEKLVLWRHCHTEGCDVHDASATLVLIGGALHNLADGALIGAAVMASIPLGVSTALAVAAHQIPQEVGDFVILLNAGYSRMRALWLNVLSALASLVGAAAVWVAAGVLPQALPHVLAVAAGGFLYVAMADLIPSLHREPIDASAFRQVLVIAAGVATIMAL